MTNEDGSQDSKTVVVVGAGAAGLQAANILLESKGYLSGRLKVVVLEGRDRVGGRICADTRWGGIPFDLGIRTSFVTDKRSKLDSRHAF
jgi:monoamine oxidase